MNQNNDLRRWNELKNEQNILINQMVHDYKNHNREHEKENVFRFLDIHNAKCEIERNYPEHFREKYRAIREEIERDRERWRQDYHYPGW